MPELRQTARGETGRQEGVVCRPRRVSGGGHTSSPDFMLSGAAHARSDAQELALLQDFGAELFVSEANSEQGTSENRGIPKCRDPQTLRKSNRKLT